MLRNFYGGAAGERRDDGVEDYQLRFCPANYIHVSQLPNVLAVLINRLPRWRQQASINSWLIQEFGLSVCYELPTGLGAIALCEQSTLELIIGRLGAVLHGRAISKLVDARSLRPVHAAIGEAGHRFCLEQLELIIGDWPPGWQRPLPEGDLTAYFFHCGLTFWRSAAGDIDEAITKRLALRLPFYPSTITWKHQSEQLPLANALCLKVARHMSPTCLHLLK